MLLSLLYKEIHRKTPNYQHFIHIPSSFYSPYSTYLTIYTFNDLIDFRYTEENSAMKRTDRVLVSVFCSPGIVTSKNVFDRCLATMREESDTPDIDVLEEHTKIMVEDTFVGDKRPNNVHLRTTANVIMRTSQLQNGVERWKHPPLNDDSDVNAYFIIGSKAFCFAYLSLLESTRLKIEDNPEWAFDMMDRLTRKGVDLAIVVLNASQTPYLGSLSIAMEAGDSLRSTH